VAAYIPRHIWLYLVSSGLILRISPYSICIFSVSTCINLYRLQSCQYLPVSISHSALPSASWSSDLVFIHLCGSIWLHLALLGLSSIAWILTCYSTLSCLTTWTSAVSVLSQCASMRLSITYIPVNSIDSTYLPHLDLTWATLCQICCLNAIWIWVYVFNHSFAWVFMDSIFLGIFLGVSVYSRYVVLGLYSWVWCSFACFLFGSSVLSVCSYMQSHRVTLYIYHSHHVRFSMLQCQYQFIHMRILPPTCLSLRHMQFTAPSQLMYVLSNVCMAFLLIYSLLYSDLQSYSLQYLSISVYQCICMNAVSYLGFS
jgi:hypothetical protein